MQGGDQFDSDRETLEVGGNRKQSFFEALANKHYDFG